MDPFPFVSEPAGRKEGGRSAAQEAGPCGLCGVIRADACIVSDVFRFVSDPAMRTKDRFVAQEAGSAWSMWENLSRVLVSGCLEQKTAAGKLQDS